MIQTIEECAELTEALCHHMRGRQSDVIGELADVTIMVRQMTLAFGEEEVARAVEMKLERLRLRMAA
jgi:NTP pyrophosphatase (non-canonical NTP hydrolase)